MDLIQPPTDFVIPPDLTPSDRITHPGQIRQRIAEAIAHRKDSASGTFTLFMVDNRLHCCPHRHHVPVGLVVSELSRFTVEHGFDDRQWQYLENRVLTLLEGSI